MREIFIQTCTLGLEIFYSIKKIIETSATTLKVCKGLLPEILKHIRCHIEWDVFSFRPVPNNYTPSNIMFFPYKKILDSSSLVKVSILIFDVRSFELQESFSTRILQIDCPWSECSFLYDSYETCNFMVQNGIKLDEIHIVTSRACWNRTACEYLRNRNRPKFDDVNSTNPNVKNIYIEITEVNRYTMLDCLPYFMNRLKLFFPNLEKCTMRLIKVINNRI